MSPTDPVSLIQKTTEIRLVPELYVRAALTYLCLQEREMDKDVKDVLVRLIENVVNSDDDDRLSSPPRVKT